MADIEEDIEVVDKEDDNINDIFKDIKDIIIEQQKEIQTLKDDIKKLTDTEKTEEKNAFDDFKEDIKKMLQGYNRNNPENNTNDIDFEKTQMDILNRRF